MRVHIAKTICITRLEQQTYAATWSIQCDQLIKNCGEQPAARNSSQNWIEYVKCGRYHKIQIGMPDAALCILLVSRIHGHKIVQQYASLQAVSRCQCIKIAHQHMWRPLQRCHNAQDFSYFVPPDA